MTVRVMQHKVKYWAELQVDPARGPQGLVQPCPKPRALIHKPTAMQPGKAGNILYNRKFSGQKDHEIFLHMKISCHSISVVDIFKSPGVFIKPLMTIAMS